MAIIRFEEVKNIKDYPGLELMNPSVCKSYNIVLFKNLLSVPKKEFIWERFRLIGYSGGFYLH